MIEAAALLAGLAALTGAGLATAAARLRADDRDAIERVNQLLPQSQCAQCGYPGCRPYAAAVLAGEAPIDRCAPGGRDTLEALARLLQEAAPPLPAEGAAAQAESVAVIDEALCIGCARCLAVCPVDAILGAPRFMHTVLVDECTGCELCLAPCPVDCIDLVPRARPA